MAELSVEADQMGSVWVLTRVAQVLTTAHRHCNLAGKSIDEIAQ